MVQLVIVQVIDMIVLIPIYISLQSTITQVLYYKQSLKYYLSFGKHLATYHSWMMSYIVKIPS